MDIKIKDFSNEVLIEEAAKRGLGNRICERQKEIGNTIAWQIWNLEDVENALDEILEYDGLEEYGLQDLSESELEKLKAEVVGNAGCSAEDGLEDCAHNWEILDDIVRNELRDAAGFLSIEAEGV